MALRREPPLQEKRSEGMLGSGCRFDTPIHARYQVVSDSLSVYWSIVIPDSALSS